MEAKIALKTQFPAFMDMDKFMRRPSVSLPLSKKLREQQGRPILISCQHRSAPKSQKQVAVDPSVTFRNSSAPKLEPGSFPPSDEDLILKNKSQEILPYLNGRCIYLVGMMGSGKTTVGKILAELLGYSFCDSDTLVELATEGTSVAEIFNLHGEGFFRNMETETLKKLSLLRHVVVSTGGGAVIRPLNWKYMGTGISLWLDVPLEALAQRISAVGTNSRPLLHDGSGDAYERALTRLSNLWKDRGDAYANANARVSLEEIAAKLGHGDITNITPTAIAIEALEQIETFLKQGNGMDVVEL